MFAITAQMTPKENLSPSKKTSDRELDVPSGHGLMIQLRDDGSVSVDTKVPDQRYPNIHPNCYAPADMKDVRLLHGGGSGTAVFGGEHPTLHSIVMKHGGPKDIKEVFALATITAELIRRRQQSSNENSEVDKAADDMKRRIPEFVMVYISPHHLRDRGKELWASIRNIKYTRSGRRISLLASPEMKKNCDKVAKEEEEEEQPAEKSLSRSDLQKLAKLPPFKNMMPKRTIRVHSGSRNHPLEEWCVGSKTVDVDVPPLTDDNTVESDGIRFLKDFCDVLVNETDMHTWKVTLAQKTIGGANAENGADVLTSGRLQGALLDTLIREFTLVMQDMDRLTLPEERLGRALRVKEEVATLKELQDVTAVSKTADSFVGGAISKNFHPENGRFVNLRLLGDDFRFGNFFLTDKERVPARFLGAILQCGACIEEIFDDPPSKYSALDCMEDRGWLDILEHASQFPESSSAAVDCIWTCGLTDAGLHNTFLSEERGLEIFDLGEPTLEPRPAFLTKFLMSFFHTLGMESDGKGSWKIRFRVVRKNGDEMLALTAETKDKIPYICQVFTETINKLIENIFNGDECVRKLLIKYVVLQLLSDSSFCLRRWESKGGGAERYGDRLQDPMEKWLWRSLWDQYIASYVHDNLLLEAGE